MELHAEILPNEHKYYGTEIRLTTEDGRVAEFNVWINRLSPDGKPSSREYDYLSQDTGKPMTIYDEGTEFEFHDEYEICDDHYETATVLHICRTIVASLDGLEI